MPAIGIDLGTTYTCAAVVKDGAVEIIFNSEGNNLTDSWVAFVDGEKIVGEFGKNYVLQEPESVVYDAKRLIGRSYDEACVQRDMKVWPFKVIKYDDRVKVRVKDQGKYQDFFPEEISAMILKKMKEVSEEMIGEEVTDAVITVPAYFNQAQRQATKSAGEIAGFNVLRILSEPTAAAVAFGVNTRKKNKTVLVFDLGGGTFDVSILTLEGEEYNVRATTGKDHLGGEDFDQNLIQHCLKRFGEEHGVDIAGNKKAIQKLRKQAERAKRMLSNVKNAHIAVDMLYEGKDYRDKITRARYEEQNLHLFQETIDCIEDALEQANMSKEDIDEVVLVGGSSITPKVREMVQKYFNGKRLNSQVNPAEAVAQGAAIMANVLSDQQPVRGQLPELRDVTPLSLGTDMIGNRMSVLIKRNTTIPCSCTQSYTTTSDKQSSMGVQVREGERPLASENTMLGNFSLGGLPKRPAGEVSVAITFTLDENSILHVTAEETSEGARKEMTIKNDKGRLSEEEIALLILQADINKIHDQEELRRLNVKYELQSLAFKLKRVAPKAYDRGQITLKLQKETEEMCINVIDWIENTPRCSRAKCEELLRGLRQLSHHIDDD